MSPGRRQSLRSQLARSILPARPRALLAVPLRQVPGLDRVEPSVGGTFAISTVKYGQPGSAGHVPAGVDGVGALGSRSLARERDVAVCERGRGGCPPRPTVAHGLRMPEIHDPLPAKGRAYIDTMAILCLSMSPPLSPPSRLSPVVRRNLSS
jgi:hypothetical protein